LEEDIESRKHERKEGREENEFHEIIESRMARIFGDFTEKNIGEIRMGIWGMRRIAMIRMRVKNRYDKIRNTSEIRYKRYPFEMQTFFRIGKPGRQGYGILFFFSIFLIH